ncbi:hypothetical protein Slin15195_G033830 [Septoria linicola]|uniref:Transmembrane protein n=1 Tax=Septoria linicola TaxID=215465 RepID=A0A9Q9AL83_9PEZI|nr:hypothetical protein Slin15195_G033830 [Septoria linicola]
MGIAILVLLVSDDKSRTTKAGNKWPKWIAPSVILSGLNSFSSLCFSVAIANGVAIAWWRQTLKGATIKQLHKSWSFAPFIALAALTMKLTIIDGVLMQSASRTVFTDDDPRHNVTNIMTLKMHQVIPTTGWVSPGNNGPGFMTAALRENVKGWQTNIVTPEISQGVLQGCEGICFANVTGASILNAVIYRRTQSTGAQILSTAQVTALRVLMDALNQEYDNTMFKINSQAIYDEGNVNASSLYINMKLVYTQTDGKGESDAPPEQSCAGRRVSQSCKLWPATITYPIMVTNAGALDLNGDGKPDDEANILKTSDQTPQTVRVGAVEAWWVDWTPYSAYQDMYRRFERSKNQQGEFTILNRTPILEDHRAAFPSTDRVESRLAGLEVALNAVFGGEAHLNKQQSGYVLQQNGTVFSWSMGNPAWDRCNYNFRNPVNSSNRGEYSNAPDSIFASISSLMFLVAADAAGYDEYNKTTGLENADREKQYNSIQHNATIYTKSVHYKTNKYYMLGACLSTLFCVLCVIPVYWGYWQLGRDVSLGPFEIAHAFQSPLTSEAFQGSIRELLQEVGKREVRYGQYTTDDPRTVFVVADPDQLANLDRDTKAEFRQQMSHVFSRERSQRTLQTLKTFGVKVEENRDSM